jgi:hypothetical protein
MTENLNDGALSDVPWPTHAERLRVPNTSMLPRSEAAPSDATDSLDAALQDARATRDAWIDGLRCTVRNKPLASLVAAVAVGMVMARIIRSQR